MVPFPFSVFVIKTPDSVRVNIGNFWDYLWWQKKEIYLWICTSTRYKDHKCIIWWHINGSCDSINNVKITRELLSWRFLRAMACVELKPNTECKTHKGCTAVSSPRWICVLKSVIPLFYCVRWSHMQADLCAYTFMGWNVSVQSWKEDRQEP